MIRTFLSRFLLPACLVGGLVAPAVAADEVVNVYTQRHYDTDQALYDKFTEQTGIKVNVVKAQADELIQRLEAEGDRSPADVFMTVDMGRMTRAAEAGLLQPISSEVVEAQVPDVYRDDENRWVGLTKRGRVVVYHKDRVKPEELSTYEALVDPKWKERILVRSGNNPYNVALVASLVGAHGEEATEAWVKGLVANMARPSKGNDRDQMRAVAAGEGDLAIVNTYYLGLLSAGDDADQAVAEQLAVFFPNQADRGTHVNLSSAAVTKSAPNKENAVALLEFLTGPEAQQALADANFEYPLNPAVKPAGVVESWGPFEEDAASLKTLGAHENTALKIADRAGWQ